MWLFCKHGFFSAVQHKDKSGRVLVRARFSGDLEKLFKVHGVTAKILKTPDADYLFRTELDKSEWARIVKEEAEAIDYCNFKNAVHDGSPRDSAYMDTWLALRKHRD
jgi:hypothetical protein